MAQLSEVARLKDFSVASPDDHASVGLSRGWVTEVERIVLATRKLGGRSIALTSPRRAVGCDSLTKLLARNFYCSAWSSLRIDLTRPLQSNDVADDWIPGRELGPQTKTPYGFDEVVVHPSEVSRSLYSNVELMRRSLDQDFTSYDRVVVSLPPVLEASGNYINAVSASLACDVVFLVCATGVTRRADVSTAIERLEDAGSNIVGTILNNANTSTPGQDLAKLSNVIAWVSPSLADRYKSYVLSIGLLNP